MSDGYRPRPNDPNLSAVCAHPGGNVVLPLPSLNPDDVAAAFRWHDWATHNPGAWLVGGAGGNGGDICNPCAGWNAKDGKALIDGPRHDLCHKGKGSYRGSDCGCTHDKPHMRGVKLGPDGKWPSKKNPTKTPHPTNPAAALLNIPTPEPHTPAGLFDVEDPDA